MINRITGRLLREIGGYIWGGYQPDFFIVGAQKSGTTSLFKYLNECDGFRGAVTKEVHFFDMEERYKKGFGWYQRHFIRSPWSSDLLFEASPTYLFRENVPGRIKSYRSDAKVIMLLREPISRAYSAWNMYRQWSDESRVPRLISKNLKEGFVSPLFKIFFENGCPTFSEYVEHELRLIELGKTDEEPSILSRGIYKPQIRRYVDCFGVDNVLVLGFSELKNDPTGVIKKCHEFLNVPYLDQVAIGAREVQNKRDYPHKISPEDSQILHNFYDPHNSELFEYIGHRPDW
jgi:hypothetical protein